MDYEAWFGPTAVTFQGTAALPRLQSPDMQPVGGGSDSADLQSSNAMIPFLRSKRPQLLPQALLAIPG